MNTKDLKNYINEVLGDSVRCLLPSFWWKKLFGEVVDTVESVEKSVEQHMGQLSTRMDSVEENSITVVDVTYEELCIKKMNGKLVPGQFYRIIDYECTVNDDDPDISVVSKDDRYNYIEFCIVVQATTKTQLNKNAYATPRKNNDRGIGFSIYNALEIKYTLSNDKKAFSWARIGENSYDVAAIYDNNGYTRSGLFFWNELENRYIDQHYNSLTLVKSLSDKTPISKTTFNKGEIIYILDGSDVIESTAVYVDAMKDVGEGVIVNGNKGYNNYYYYHPFIWDDSRGMYIHNIDGGYEYLATNRNEGYPIEKKDFFTRNESFIINKYVNGSHSQGGYNGYGEAKGFYIPNGKGVIYHMKDFKGNEAPYDFKHIVFKFPEISDEPRFTFHNRYWVDNIQMNVDASERNFSDDTEVYNNKINIYIDEVNHDYTRCLNKISLDTPTAVEVSSQVYNQCFTDSLKYKHIGFDSNRNISVVNIHDKSSTVTLDSSLSTTSTNGIQNKVVAEEMLKLTCNFILPANNSTQLTSSEKTSNKNAYNRYINATNKPCVSCSVAGVVRAVPFRIEVQNNALHLFMFDDIDNMGDLRNVIVNSDGSVTMTEYNGTINTSDSNIIFYLPKEIDTPLTEGQIAHNIEMFNKVKNATYIPSASFAIGSIINDKPAFTNHTGLSTSYVVDDELGEIVIITCFIGGAWQEAVFKSDGTGEINN